MSAKQRLEAVRGLRTGFLAGAFLVLVAGIIRLLVIDGKAAIIRRWEPPTATPRRAFRLRYGRSRNSTTPASWAATCVISPTCVQRIGCWSSPGAGRSCKVVEDAPAKSTKKPKAPEKKLSALNAAARVLAESKAPMTTREMIDAMATKGYWTSPGGKTPHATLYSAILRVISAKGKEARFAKTERGKFAAK